MRTLVLALSAVLIAAAALGAENLNGVVTNPDGKPVPAAHVYVYTAWPKVGVTTVCPSCYRDCGKQVAAGANGSFRIAALDSTLLFDILVVADGYEPAFARRVNAQAGQLRVTLTPRSAADADRLITGTVLGPDGKPVVGATVEPNGYHLIEHTPDGRMRGSVGYGNLPGLDPKSITNGHGEFALRMPDSKGKLDVRVTARSLAPHIERLLVPGEVRAIHLIEGAAITGHVVKNGQPVPGVRVGFVQPGGPAGDYLGRAEIATNNDGAFLMTNLAPDHQYIVYVPMDDLSHGAVQAKTVRVAGDKSAIDAGTLDVVAGRRISGRVVTPENVPIPPHTMVTVTTQYGDQRSVELRGPKTFVIDSVPTGAARLTTAAPQGAAPDSGRSRRPVAVTLPPEGNVDNVQLVYE